MSLAKSLIASRGGDSSCCRLRREEGDAPERVDGRSADSLISPPFLYAIPSGETESSSYSNRERSRPNPALNQGYTWAKGARGIRATIYRASGTICGAGSRYAIRLLYGVVSGSRFPPLPHFLTPHSTAPLRISLPADCLCFAVRSERLFLVGTWAPVPVIGNPAVAMTLPPYRMCDGWVHMYGTRVG